MRLLDQIQLAADEVDAVQYVVEWPGEEFLPVGGVVGGADGVHHGVGVDIPHPGGHHLGLVLPHGGGQGAQLPVDVGHGHRVLIHQR